jgi:N4-gp56 family major capsid protein
MPNVFTDTSGASLGTSLVQTAYDRAVEFALRSVPTFDAFCDKHPEAQAMPGSTVVLQLFNDMAVATTPLTETVDPDSVAIGNTTSVSVTLAEYGNAALLTHKLRLFNLSRGGIDSDVANIIGYNMIDSLDVVAQNVIRTGTNTIREIGGSISFAGTTATVTGTDTAKARDFLAAVTKLRSNKAIPNRGSAHYTAILSPEASYDLRTQTGQGGWLTPNEYGASQQKVWDGEIGAFGGAVFIESPRCYMATDGATSAKVYRSYVFGRQAFVSAYAERPHVVLGPVVDKLRRFQPIGWLGVLGYGIYRQAAVYRVETSASL